MAARRLSRPGNRFQQGCRPPVGRPSSFAAQCSFNQFLKAIKRSYSFRIKRILQEIKSPLLKGLTIRQRPGIETFRYWQEGPGYDRSLDHAKSVLAAIDYFHRNPVRRGSVARAIDWHWSSARWYEGLPYEANIRVPKLEKLSAEFLVSAAR